MSFYLLCCLPSFAALSSESTANSPGKGHLGKALLLQYCSCALKYSRWANDRTGRMYPAAMCFVIQLHYLRISSFFRDILPLSKQHWHVKVCRDANGTFAATPSFSLYKTSKFLVVCVSSTREVQILMHFMLFALIHLILFVELRKGNERKERSAILFSLSKMLPTPPTKFCDAIDN